MIGYAPCIRPSYLLSWLHMRAGRKYPLCHTTNTLGAGSELRVRVPVPVSFSLLGLGLALCGHEDLARLHVWFLIRLPGRAKDSGQATSFGVGL